jgi:hypothetical protein
MRAHRRRHIQPGVLPTTSATVVPSWPQVYECPGCEQRLLDVRRCPDCNLFARKLGPGGACPHCDEPVVVADLIDVGSAR